MASLTVEELPPIRKKDRELMENQRAFIRKIYFIALFFYMAALVEWTGITEFYAIKDLIDTIYSLEHFIIWLAFLSLLAFMFFFKTVRKSSLFNAWLAACGTAEIGTIILAQVVKASTWTDIFYAFGITDLMLLVGVPLSLQLHDEMQYPKKSLMVWTGRYYLLSGFGSIFLKAIGSHWFSLFVSLLINFFMLVHMLKFCKAIGSMDFYLSSKAAYLLYSTLLFYNLIAIYATTLEVLNAIRKLKIQT